MKVFFTIAAAEDLLIYVITFTGTELKNLIRFN